LLEIHQLIRIMLLTFGFLEIYGSLSQFPVGGKVRFASPLRTTMEVKLLKKLGNISLLKDRLDGAR